MITSVYLSNNNVQVLLGEPKGKGAVIREIYETRLEEGCLINGVITGAAELKEQLSTFWNSNQIPKKNVAVVINSTQFVQKDLELPNLNGRKLMALIPNEFLDTERGQDSIYDYMEQSKERRGKMAQIHAVRAERSFVQSYVEVFREMGIELSSITTSLCAAMKTLDVLPELGGETCIIEILDGNSMTSLLWEHGQCVYSNKSRLFSEEGTDDFAREAVQNVNSIMQFHASRKSEYKIDKAYLCGMSEITRDKCKPAISALGLQAEELTGEGAFSLEGGRHLFGDCVFASGTLLTLSKDVNLYRAWKKNPKESEKKNEILKTVLPGAITLGLCLAITGGLLIFNKIKENKIESIEEFLSDETNISLANEYSRLEMENTKLSHRISALSGVQNAIASYPVMDSAVNEVVNACGGTAVNIAINSYDSATGALTMDASASQVTEINSFVKRLQEAPIFSSVEYSGYQLEEKKGQYNIDVACYLKGTQTEENGQDSSQE